MTVSRRRAILATASAAWLASSRTLRAQSPRTHDVLVLGAGLAGLHAASLLTDQGLNVRILEASARPGGRCRTAHQWDSRIELGASQIGPRYARVLDTAQRLGIRLAPGAHINAPYAFVCGDSLIAAKDWSASSANPLPDAERAIAPHTLISHFVEQRNPFNSPEQVYSSQGRIFDIDLASWLRRQDASEAAQHFINETLGRPGLHQISLLRMLQEATRLQSDRRLSAGDDGAPQQDTYQRAGRTSIHVVGGTSVLTDAMASALGDRLIYRQRAIAIDQTGPTVQVSCDNGHRWYAEHVIAALPFTQLRKLALTPALTHSALESVTTMPYGNQSQVWLRTQSAYWETDEIEASMWTDGLFTLIRQQIEHDGSRELISALAFGPKSRALDALTPEQRGQRAIEFIERIRPSTRGKLEFIGAHSWELEPDIGGCSYQLQPGAGVDWVMAITQPVGRLHFAGEHTRRLEVGMEAAMESGERAALEVLNTLG